MNLFSGGCLRIIWPYAVCLLLKYHPIWHFQQHLHHWLHPLIIFPLCCIMGFAAAQWFLLFARYELAHWSTHPNIRRYCHCYFNSFHFSPDMSFVPYLIWTPLAPVWHRQRPTHWFNPALYCSNFVLIFFLYPVWNLSQSSSCTSTSVWLSLLQFCSPCSWLGLFLQFSKLVSGSRPLGTAQTDQPSSPSTKAELGLFPAIIIPLSPSSQAGF